MGDVLNVAPTVIVDMNYLSVVLFLSRGMRLTSSPESLSTNTKMSKGITISRKLCPGQFLGREHKRRRAADCILTEYSYLPDTRVEEHVHELPYFNLIIEGAYDETHGGKVHQCKASMLLFHPEGEVHSDWFRSKRCRIFSFEIGLQWVERARQHSLALNRRVELSAGPAVWLAYRLYKERNSTDTAFPLIVEGILLEIIGETLRHDPPGGVRLPPSWLEKARDFIHSKFTDPISPNAVAEVVGVHPTHLSREFRRYYNLSIGEYVRRLRVEYSRREVAESRAPLTDIAAAAGFADHGHFTRTFKSLTGLTPSQYRSSFRPR
jgi:AraC-like DNA-binding protein